MAGRRELGDEVREQVGTGDLGQGRGLLTCLRRSGRSVQRKTRSQRLQRPPGAGAVVQGQAQEKAGSGLEKGQVGA